MSSEIHIRSIDEFNKLNKEDLANVKSIIFNAFVDREKEIPERIYDCVNLDSLTFFHMNQLVVSPKIAQLKQLDNLEIQGGTLTTLPKEFGQLQTLSKLHLENCPITTLPKEFGQLQTLSKLHLENCPITTLPKEFGTLTTLTILQLKDMPLTTIPKCIFDCHNLVELSLRGSKIKEIPKNIAKLQQLKKLCLRHSSVEKLSEAITELPNLEEFILYGVPIQTLPEWIGNLKKIKLLNVPKTHYKEIPYFLFQLKKLAYYAIPEFTVTDIDKAITTQLQKYLKRHVSINCAKAYTHLMLSPNKASDIPPKFFVETTNIDDKKVAHKAIQYLKKMHSNTLKSHPISAGSSIIFLGKLEGLDIDYIKTQLQNNDVIIQTKVAQSTTHVVLCYENKRKFDPAKFPHLVLLSNQEIINWMKIHEGAGYLEQQTDDHIGEMHQSIQELLLSSTSGNVYTGLEMLKSGGIHSSFICPLLIAYSNTPNRTTEQKELRHAIRTTLYQSSLSENAKKQIRGGLSKGGFSFSPSQERYEREYKKRLERKGNKEFNMLGIATYYFETRQRGYLYLMESEQVGQTDKISFIQTHFIQGKTLNLSNLKQLNKIPPILKHFQEIEVINLENCAFAVFPSLLRDGAFPKLQQINLKGNPISSLSKTVLKKLAHCEILLD